MCVKKSCLLNSLRKMSGVEAVIVAGEASESEDEIEILNTPM